MVRHRLRPDGGATLDGGGLNVCLLWLPVADSDSRLELIGTAKEETTTGGTRTRLLSRLGLSSIRATRLDDVILEILSAPPASGWKPLAATRDGFLEAHLGGLIKRVPVVRGGSTITETFNKADNGLGPDLTWTEYFTSGGGTQIGVLDNQAAMTFGIGESEHRAETDLATDDHYAEAVAGASYTANSPVFLGLAHRLMWLERLEGRPRVDAQEVPQPG